MALKTGITAEERAAILGHIFDHLSGLEDLYVAIQDEDFETAERLGQEYGDELRLLEDLGWADPPTDETIRLTMPPEEVLRVFTRLRSDAEGLRRSEEREEAEVEDARREHRNRAQRVTDVCNRVLDVVNRTPPPDVLREGA
ncbi:MAG TPA: hypothetical protein VHU86_09100 [Solirubrobacterales bacterium]|nr:hypothetical protein [Solirubrobacterales bacterium]